jgi:hypothetical protein
MTIFCWLFKGCWLLWKMIINFTGWLNRCNSRLFLFVAKALQTCNPWIRMSVKTEVAFCLCRELGIIVVITHCGDFCQFSAKKVVFFLENQCCELSMCSIKSSWYPNWENTYIYICRKLIQPVNNITDRPLVIHNVHIMSNNKFLKSSWHLQSPLMLFLKG